jgi:dipeptidyl aminopeptidase/acylaminoacyl peptidase
MSPDGKQIAFHSLAKGNRDIYLMDANGGNLTPIVATPAEELSAIWKRDGTGLVFLIFPDSTFQLDRNAAGNWGKPKFVMSKAIFGGFSPDGQHMVVAGLEPGVICQTCQAGVYLGDQHFGNWKLIPPQKIIPAIASPGSFAFSRDSRHLYLSVREKDGTASIWQLAINGDPERRLVHLSDASRQFYRMSLDVDDKNFYFTIGDRQSDIWTMELKKQ